MSRRVPTEEEYAISPEQLLLRWEEQRREERLESAAMFSLLYLLPVRWREVAELRWLDGWSEARVGEALNLTRREVRTLEARARSALIDLVAGEVS